MIGASHWTYPGTATGDCIIHINIFPVHGESNKIPRVLREAIKPGTEPEWNGTNWGARLFRNCLFFSFKPY